MSGGARPLETSRRRGSKRRTIWSARADGARLHRDMKKVSSRRYIIRAVVFQEGEWLCVQCLDYNLATQAKTLLGLNRAFQQLIIGHIAIRLRHNQRPFEGLRRAPKKYWAMFERSKLPLPAQMLNVNGRKSHGPIIARSIIRVAPLAA